MAKVKLGLGALVVGLSGALFVLASPASAMHSPFGIYPDCVGPAIPVEAQAWWQANTDPVPRHLHMATCIPNARTTDPNAKIVEEDLNVPVTVRVVTFNNPDIVEYVQMKWVKSPSGTNEKVYVNFQCTPGSGLVVGPHGEELCTWYWDFTLNATDSQLAFNELRFNTKIPENFFLKEQFLSLNFQVWTPVDSGARRSTTNPRGKGWYTDLLYAQVNVNYADFFNGVEDLDLAVPQVSGNVQLEAQHRRGEGDEVWSTLWLDTNFHLYPYFWDTAEVGVPHPSGGELLYKVSGNAELTYMWDTTGLANGIHTLFFQTIETDSTGTNAGGLKLLFDVQNGPPPDFDVAVTALDAPVSVPVGQPVNVDVVIKNQGVFAASAIVVDLAVDGSLVETKPTPTDPLEAGNTTTVQFVWDTVGASAGSHTLRATADLAGDENSANDFREATVTVSTANTMPPVASFGASCTDLSCNFTDMSTDSDGFVVSWSWSFGDGATSTAQNPSHTYAAYGTYPVTLTVGDDDGDSGSTSQSVTVNNLGVTGITPSAVQMPTTFLATITGTGFAAGAQVSFSNGAGPTPKVTNVKVLSSTITEATIKIKTGGPPRPRMWDLTVTAGGSSVTLQDALTVLP